MSISCIDVVGLEISPNPQSGINNVFGVQVYLDYWPVDENVTVTGYLRDNSNITNIYDFNLTINTGTQSAETANNVLICDPTATATVFITGVTPTTVTYTGTSYPICGYEVTPTPTETIALTPTPTETPASTPASTPTNTPTPDSTPASTPTSTPITCYFYTNSSGVNWNGDWVDCDGTTHFAENVPDGSSICARPTPFTLSGVDLIQGSVCSGPPPTPSSTPSSTPASTPASTPGLTPNATPTPTPTATVTPTETPTPNSTPTSAPISLYRYSAASAEDACSGGLTMTNVVLYGGGFCDGTGIQCDEFALEAGGINLWVSSGGYSRYVVIDDPNISGTATYVGPCEVCGSPTPTPTNSATPTPTPSNTETPTQTPSNSPTQTPSVTPTQTPTPSVTETQTPTPSPTEPYDVYLFQDCCDVTNLFRYENVSGLLITGNTYHITGGSGFNGCATVQVYSPTGTVYPGSGVNFQDQGPSNCATCTSFYPCPTPTPTVTTTQTQTPSVTPTQTQTPSNSPTPSLTPTDTPDPTATPTQTPVVPTVDCFSATTTGTTWFYHDCCGDYIAGTDIGLPICVDTLRPYNGINVSGSQCLTPVCYSAATLADCCTGEIFFALVDQTTADGNASYGVVYRFNDRSYYFIRFGGPGGPYVGLPDFGSCEKANEAYPCLTPTPTVTQSPFLTPTMTPTPSITPPHCESNAFCLTTQFSGLNQYNGTYTQYTTYNTKNAYSGDGTTTGYIFYTGSYWCLSASLGGSCLLQGASPCYSVCPDISGEVFTTGICPTPTPTPADCSTLDFLAYFDCDYEPLPTPTPSVPCDLVNFDMTGIGVTPTPTQTGPACQTFLDFSLSGYTIPPTPTITASPTITLTRTVAEGGRVTFTLLEDTFVCTTVRVLQDCDTGQEYLTSQALFYSGSTGLIPITSGLTMLVLIQGSPVCVNYVTDRKGSSTTIIDEVVALYSNCTFCNPVVTQTPTPTATNTQTPTPTPGITPSQTSTPTITPTNTATQSPTPSMTASPGSDPSPTPSVTATQTPTPSVTVTTTPSNTPTYTMTPTPSPTSTWVYVYESCTVVPSKIPRKTQVIQTQPVTFVGTEGRTFKSSDGVCWKYVGQFNTNYIAPLGIDSFTYEGNYFVDAINYVYQNCDECLAVTVVDPCVDYVYYTAQRCDNSEVINAKACDIVIDITVNFFELGIGGTQTSSTSLAPTVGQVVTVTSYDTNNTITDQFCATILSIISEVNTSNIAGSTLFGGSVYTCDTCPLYNRYTISTCNDDDAQVTNFPLYVPYTVDLLNVGDVISVNENANCFTVITVEGLTTEPYLSVLTTNSLAYTYEAKYQDCNGCFQGQDPIIEDGIQVGTDPYIPEDNRGGSGSDTLYISTNLPSPERGREYLINYAESDTQNNLQ